MQQEGLYNPTFEHDACGVGFVAHLKGEKSHQQVAHALTMLENMEHRGACGCDPESGDGAGIMIQLPHEFLWEECIDLGIQLQEPGYYGVGMVLLKEKEMNRICRETIVQAVAEKADGILRIPCCSSEWGRNRPDRAQRRTGDRSVLCPDQSRSEIQQNSNENYLC